MNPSKTDQLVQDNLCIMVGRFPSLLDKRVGEMSFGQKKQLAIFIGILSGADFLIIDEITEGLDAETRKELVRILKAVPQTGKTIIFAANACGIAVFLHDGSIVGDIAVTQAADLLALYKNICRRE